MKLAVYTQNAEPFVWYPTPRISFIDFTNGESHTHSIWKKKTILKDKWTDPTELLSGFDAWMWVDSRVSELTINFEEFLHQIEFLNGDKIYGIGKSDNGFRTISTGCLAESNTVRNEKLLSFIYDTVFSGARKYSLETPLHTFSSILFLRSPKTENTCRDTAKMIQNFQGLNPQVALNWAAWKNMVRIEEIEDLQIQQVRHKIWISAYVPPTSNKSSDNRIAAAPQPVKPTQRKVESKPQTIEVNQKIPEIDPLSRNAELGDKTKDLIATMPFKSVRIETHSTIDHNLLSKLAADSRQSSAENSLPTVSIMMTTWNRTPLAVKCLKGLVENIDYPSKKLYWILADDGSEPGHVEACIDALTSSGVPMDRVYATRNYRSGKDAKFGHASNLNNGLREAFKHSDIVLRTEDDLLPSQKIPVEKFAKILQNNPNVAGIKLGHAGDVTRKLPWKGDPKNFAEDASYWNVFIFNHLAMICHKRIYDELGMYNEKLSGADVEKDIGKRFMDKFRKRTTEQEYSMKVLAPILSENENSRNAARWFYFTHIGMDSVSGHHYRTMWSDDVVKLNSKELAENIRAESAKI